MIADELALIRHPVDDLDLVIALLNGLGPSFHEFNASICTGDSPLLFDELYDKLVDYEIFLQCDERHQQPLSITANLASHSPAHGRSQHPMPPSGNASPRSHGCSSLRSFTPTRHGPSNQHLVCQFCDHRGHTAKTCYRLHGYPLNHPRRQANVMQKENAMDSTWLLDFGASHHVTRDLANR